MNYVMVIKLGKASFITMIFLVNKNQKKNAKAF